MISLVNLDEVFKNKRGQRRVAEFLLKKGIRVSKDERLLLGEVELTDTKIAKALNVDRRLIKSTIESILKNERLTEVYTKLGSTPNLRDVAKELGFGAIEIIPTDASSKGIVASVATIITDSDIAIRQVIADDPMFANAELTIVTEKSLPRDLIDKMLRVSGVKKVVVLN